VSCARMSCLRACATATHPPLPHLPVQEAVVVAVIPVYTCGVVVC
jgi:hypothetical protein